MYANTANSRKILHLQYDAKARYMPSTRIATKKNTSSEITEIIIMCWKMHDA